MLLLNTLFRGIARCQLGGGSSVYFWDDLWIDAILAHKYPRLASFARNDGISVFETMQAEDLETRFMLPFSEEALDDLESLQLQLQALPYDQTSQDHSVST